MRRLLIIAGPSAVGKTTVAKYILENFDGFEYVRSATTRAPRGDGHDAEYIYLTKSEFVIRAEGGEMLEYTEYEGNLYGTPRSETERIISEGKTPLLVLDVNGVGSVKATGAESFAVYLYEDIDVLEERLYARYIGENPTVAGLLPFSMRRDRNISEYAAIEEISGRFDLVLRNSDVGACAAALVSAHRDGAVFDNSAAVAEILSFAAKKQSPRR